MNKKFFETMKTFATVLLVVGLISATIVFFTTAFVTVKTPGHYYDNTETTFSWAGFASAIDTVLITVAGYFILSGISRVGVKVYADDAEADDAEADDAEAEGPELKIWKNVELPAGDYLTRKDLPIGKGYISLSSPSDTGEVILMVGEGEVFNRIRLPKNSRIPFDFEDGITMRFTAPVTIDLQPLESGAPRPKS